MFILREHKTLPTNAADFISYIKQHATPWQFFNDAQGVLEYSYQYELQASAVELSLRKAPGTPFGELLRTCVVIKYQPEAPQITVLIKYQPETGALLMSCLLYLVALVFIPFTGMQLRPLEFMIMLLLLVPAVWAIWRIRRRLDDARARFDAFLDTYLAERFPY